MTKNERKRAADFLAKLGSRLDGVRRWRLTSLLFFTAEQLARHDRDISGEEFSTFLRGMFRGEYESWTTATVTAIAASDYGTDIDELLEEHAEDIASRDAMLVVLSSSRVSDALNDILANLSLFERRGRVPYTGFMHEIAFRAARADLLEGVDAVLGCDDDSGDRAWPG